LNSGTDSGILKRSFSLELKIDYERKKKEQNAIQKIKSFMKRIIQIPSKL
jgi:hypothetical protein